MQWCQLVSLKSNDNTNFWAWRESVQKHQREEFSCTEEEIWSHPNQYVFNTQTHMSAGKQGGYKPCFHVLFVPAFFLECGDLTCFIIVHGWLRVCCIIHSASGVHMCIPLIHVMPSFFYHLTAILVCAATGRVYEGSWLDFGVHCTNRICSEFTIGRWWFTVWKEITAHQNRYATQALRI